MATAAEPAKVSGNLLQQKWGPLQVWVWALIGLGAAYLYAKHKAASTSSTQTATTATAAGEPATSPPQYVIENNLPPSGAPPIPPTPGTTSSPPVITPPGTGVTPPIAVQGGNPPKAGGPPTPVSAPPPPASPISYTVVSGDTLSSIAAKYGTTWQTLWAYNTTPGNRPAQTIAILKQRGPNLIYAGETILIPQ